MATGYECANWEVGMCDHSVNFLVASNNVFAEPADINWILYKMQQSFIIRCMYFNGVNI